MKKFKSLMLVGLMSSLLITSFGCGSKPAATEAKNYLEEIKSKGSLVAGLDDNFAPMGYRDSKNNELIGFDIDMGAEIAKRLDVEMKWQPTDWNTVTESLNTRKFDVIINGLSVTEERKKVIDFSKNYVNAGIGMVVRNEDNRINSIDDLKDKKIATQAGSSGYEACKELGIDKDLKFYDKYPEAFQDLSIGRVDVIIVDVTTGAHYINQKSGEYKIVGDLLVKEPYAIGIKKGDTELKETLDKVITEMQEDGTLSKISEKWFGTDVTK